MRRPIGKPSLAAVALAASLGALALGAAAPANAAAACKNADAVAGTVPAEDQERAVRCLINRARASAGKRRLESNRALRKVARKHSRVEDRTNCMSHQCPGEPGFSKRLEQAGYPGCACTWSAGEVIGWRRGAESTPRAIVDAWMASPAHRANLLERSRREIGVGVVYGSPRAGDGKDVVAAISTVAVGSRRRI